MDPFSDALQDYMSRPEAPSQASLARKIGITAAHFHNISKGKSRGSERIRRKIAEAIGMEYEVMIGGRALTFIYLRDCPLPRFDITTELIEHIREKGKKPPYSIAIVPVLTENAAASGRIRDIRGDIKGWFPVEGIKTPYLIAVEAEDSRYEPDVPVGGIAIITLTGFDGANEGCLYLCSDPAPVALARIFWQDDGLAVFVPPATSKNLQPYATTQEHAAEMIEGKVLRVYVPREKGAGSKRKRGVFNALDYKRK